MPARDQTAHEDPHMVEAVDAVRRIFHALRTSSQVAEARSGVTGAQLFVLQVLAERPAASLNELAERTLTHQSTVSVVVRRLVQRRLVIKRRAMDDGRRVELRLSSHGRTLVRRSPRAAQARLIDAVRLLPRREAAALAQTLRRLVMTMGAGKSPAPMFFEVR